MQCVRYSFSYNSSPEDLRDYVWRTVDFANTTYGRDSFFSRFNQMLDHARFLGWEIPRFGNNIPEVFQDLEPEAVDHIFESQAKILIDIAPLSEVVLENGKTTMVRMVCATTPAGDLVWKTHFLSDSEGHPCIDHNKKIKVKIKGTKPVCNPESVAYDQDLLISYFDMGASKIWPVPFLPESFSNHNLAQVFSVEEGVVEVVKIEEPQPIHIIALTNVPWYKSLQIDRTKLLPPPRYVEEVKQESDPDFDNYLEDLTDPELQEDSIEEEEVLEQSSAGIINVITSLTKQEEAKLKELVDWMEASNIESKEDAKKLQMGSAEDKERAEKWLLNGLNRVALLANSQSKIGAAIGLIQRYPEDPILVLQPRDKWADIFVKELNKKGIAAEVQTDDSVNRFLEGNLRVLVVHKMSEELLIDDIILINMSSFAPLTWLDQINESHQVFSISIKQLGLDDFNYVQDAEEEIYDGPGLSVIKDSTPIVADKAAKSTNKSKSKFKIKTNKGKTSSADSLESAIKMAQKKESKGLICEIADPEGNIVYISKLGAIDV